MTNPTSQMSANAAPARPTMNDADAWRAYWQARGMSWRTEPEIPAERQAYLAERRAIKPDIEQGVYPFKGVEPKLTRADVEWLLATQDDGRGPVFWEKDAQGIVGDRRAGLDLRGADLSKLDLSNLPLTHICGSLTIYQWRDVNDQQKAAAQVHLDEAILRGAHLEGASLSHALLENADLSLAHLEEANLREARLVGVDLKEAFLTQADLFGAQLEDANLSRAHLEKANLIGANMADANFFGAQLENANLSRAQLQGADLTGTSLRGATLIGAYMYNADLFGARLEHADLSRAILDYADLSKAVLDYADLNKATLTNADLGEASLQGAHLIEATVSNASLREALLIGANFNMARLERTNFIDAQLDDVDLTNAHLQGAALRGARLERANFTEAHLEHTNFTEARLAHANFTEAYMKDAILQGAQLADAIFRQAHLERANFISAHLEGAILQQARLGGADLRLTIFDSTTILNDIALGNPESGCVRVADIRWGGANLAVIDWAPIIAAGLGDERVVRQWQPPLPKDDASKHRSRKERARANRNRREQLKAEHLQAFQAAVRANRQLATVLREQGMNEEADAFAYRAQVVQRSVFAQQGKRGRAMLSLFLDLLAGHGYKPARSLYTYLGVLFGFAFLFFLAGNGWLTFGLGTSQYENLPWYEALILSVSSFHGRGFFQPLQTLGDPVAIIASVEAVFGLFIEVAFIATFTQRFFGK